MAPSASHQEDFSLRSSTPTTWLLHPQLFWNKHHTIATEIEPIALWVNPKNSHSQGLRSIGVLLRIRQKNFCDLLGSFCPFGCFLGFVADPQWIQCLVFESPLELDLGPVKIRWRCRGDPLREIWNSDLCPLVAANFGCKPSISDFWYFWKRQPISYLIFLILKMMESQ